MDFVVSKNIFKNKIEEKISECLTHTKSKYCFMAFSYSYSHISIHVYVYYIVLYTLDQKCLQSIGLG